MARRKVSPEAQIIALFTGLSDQGKQMVMFGLNAIMSNQNPEAPAVRSRAPRTPRAEAPALKEVPALGKQEMCGICSNPADHPDHDSVYSSSHVFEAPKVKKAAK